MSLKMFEIKVSCLCIKVQLVLEDPGHEHEEGWTMDLMVFNEW